MNNKDKVFIKFMISCLESKDSGISEEAYILLRSNLNLFVDEKTGIEILKKITRVNNVYFIDKASLDYLKKL